MLGVDYGLTHSCYDPTPDGRACGRCDACILRRDAFTRLGLVDPVAYASTGAETPPNLLRAVGEAFPERFAFAAGGFEVEPRHLEVEPQLFERIAGDRMIRFRNRACSSASSTIGSSSARTPVGWHWTRSRNATNSAGSGSLAGGAGAEDGT